MKIKYISMLLLGATLGLTSCDDYLDKEPESNVTPASYFTSADDLAAYTVNLYGVLTSIGPGSYGMSTFAYDNDTDNQAGTGYSNRWVPGNWKVGQSGGAWDFGNIRSVNYFLDQVLPKFEAKQISGAEAHVRHYIGEAYFLRAYLYLDKLQTLGDFPIVLTALPDDKETLVEASKRQPRYKVAQQILDDLDKALSLLQESAPGGKNRISRDAALLLRSRAALFEATWEKYHKGTAFVPGGPGWPGKAEDIQGFDIDAAAIKAARANAKMAGVDKLIHFQQRPVSELRHSKPFGFIVTNPPYGERIEEKENLPALYREIGESYKRLYRWSMYLITAYDKAENDIGRKADKNRKIYNGMMKTYYYQFLGPRPPKKGSIKE